MKYLKVYVDRHGVERRYFRRQGFRQEELPGKPGDPEFEAAYQKALGRRPEGTAAPIMIAKIRSGSGSADALVTAWLAADEFNGLDDKTRKDHRIYADRFRELFASAQVRDLRRKHVRICSTKWRAIASP